MNRKLKTNLLPALAVASVLFAAVFSHSCANTTQGPSGGLKDTIPPVLVKLNPPQGSIGVPVHGATFAFTFNEYVKVKDAKSIILSPPLKKAPKYKMKGKTLLVYFEEDFKENTTYTISFPAAINDNNENNVFPGFTYVFSTGERIDSMMITGLVQDCNTLVPVKGATVMLYKDHSDSAIYNTLPYAIAKTDDWGYFYIRNISDTTYRLYAINDQAGDNMFDPQNDLIAFVDSLIRPVNRANDTIAELLPYDMKDTVGCQSRKTEYELSLFKEQSIKQMIKNKGRVSDRSAFISFNARNAHIDSLWMRGVPHNKLISQFNIERDSLEIWINDRRRMPDTLHFYVNYLKTDTAGVLRSETEHLRVFIEGVGIKNKKKKEIERKDTLCNFKLEADAKTFEQKGFDLTFDNPIIYESFDSVQYWALNPKQQRIDGKFKLERDSLNLRHYTLMPEGTFQTGYEYYMKIPHRGFRDINGFYNDSLEVKVSLPSDETLSKISLELSGVNQKYIIDLLDEKKTNVLRNYVIEGDCTLTFPYLSKGKYSIRITEDKNKNSVVDSGSLAEHRQPEKVKFLKVNDKSFITVMESTELSYSVNLTQMFNND